MACASLLFRILQFAEDENAIPTNPMRKLPAPKPPVDPEVILGSTKRRVLTPEEAGVLLAGFPRFWWDHVITLLGCGLRISELAALRRGRVAAASTSTAACCRWSTRAMKRARDSAAVSRAPRAPPASARSPSPVRSPRPSSGNCHQAATLAPWSSPGPTDLLPRVAGRS
jgi:hypothetical protein